MTTSNYLFEINDLVMKKKILSVREHYDFEETNGTKLGEANGNFIQIPPKLVVSDSHGQELMHIEGKILSIRSQFTFYDNNGKEFATIKKKIAKVIGEEFWVEKDGVEFMRVYGNFTEHDYHMEIDNNTVATVHKKWVSLRDEISISNTGEVDHRVVLGAVIVIEHLEVKERQNKG
jgi:uncharacterized protein YxjI